MEPEPQSSTKLLEARYYRVDCPPRQKAPSVKDAVVWRKSPNMDDRVTDADDADAELTRGAEDGSIWRAVEETPEWVQSTNVSTGVVRLSSAFACICPSACRSAYTKRLFCHPGAAMAGVLVAETILAGDSERGSESRFWTSVTV